jgi:hypothetical protein
MEAPEVPTEHLHEQLEHAAEHGGAAWVSGVALSSAIIAALAALASLLAGAHANEAMMKQIEAADQWNFFQAKGVKAAVLSSKIDLLEAEGREVKPADKAKAAEYKQELEGIMAAAKHKTAESHEHLETHENMARAVTFFQVSIALGAVAALTKRRRYWFVSMAVATGGVVFLSIGGVSHFRLSAAEHQAEHAPEGHGGAPKEHH